MVSAALIEWRTTRSGRLDNLVKAHRAITGGTTGRKWLTTEINHSLILRLASEYQGYCRDLHDEAIDAVLSCKCSADQAMSSVVRALLETGPKASLSHSERFGPGVLHRPPSLLDWMRYSAHT